jgi:hypothetical protein
MANYKLSQNNDTNYTKTQTTNQRNQQKLDLLFKLKNTGQLNN